MDYTELKRLAEAATSEEKEWFALDAKGWCIASEAYDAQAYISAASPDVVLSLIAQNQALVEVLNMWQALAKGDSETHTDVDGCKMQTLEQYSTYFDRLEAAKKATSAALAPAEGNGV